MKQLDHIHVDVFMQLYQQLPDPNSFKGPTFDVALRQKHLHLHLPLGHPVIAPIEIEGYRFNRERDKDNRPTWIFQGTVIM